MRNNFIERARRINLANAAPQSPAHPQRDERTAARTPIWKVGFGKCTRTLYRQFYRPARQPEQQAFFPVSE